MSRRASSISPTIDVQPSAHYYDVISGSTDLGGFSGRLIVKKYRLSADVSLHELEEYLDDLWNQIGVDDSTARERASCAGIRIVDVPSGTRSDLIHLEPTQAGLDPATTAVIVAFAPVAAQMCSDLWDRVFFPMIVEKFGRSSLEEQADPEA